MNTLMLITMFTIMCHFLLPAMPDEVIESVMITMLKLDITRVGVILFNTLPLVLNTSLIAPVMFMLGSFCHSEALSKPMVIHKEAT